MDFRVCIIAVFMSLIISKLDARRDITCLAAENFSKISVELSDLLGTWYEIKRTPFPRENFLRCAKFEISSLETPQGNIQLTLLLNYIRSGFLEERELPTHHTKSLLLARFHDLYFRPISLKFSEAILSPSCSIVLMVTKKNSFNMACFLKLPAQIFLANRVFAVT